MGLLKTSIEILNDEYRNRASLSSFGHNAATLRLLSDSVVVRKLFEDLLKSLQQAPKQIDETDFDFLGWSDETRWQKPDPQKYEDICLGDSILTKQLAECLEGDYGEKLGSMDYELFEEFMDGLINTKNAEVAIEENISILRKTLSDIYHFKTTYRWEKKQYAKFYHDRHEDHLNTFGGIKAVKEYHEEWLNTQVGEPDLFDLEQRRRELVIAMVTTGFFNAMRKLIHVPALDDLSFGVIKDEALLPNLNEMLMFMAALKKLCPLCDGMICFDEQAALGKYIYENNIPYNVCKGFFYNAAQIELVQQEMEWLTHPETKPQMASVVVKIFVDRVKQLMTMAAEQNNVMKALTTRGHEDTYLYNVDARGVSQLMDELLAGHETLISNYLGGATDVTANSIKYVAPFIGFLLDTHNFTPAKMPKKDFIDVFKKIYGNNTSAVLKMSNKYPSDEAKILFEATEKLIKKHEKS